ncbi:extracellular solute-binding protein, family 3 [Mariniphaga anaerophila]|uniref:Extracellular solute-binding protein, family 3 n=1 Tax=Mariniphaga anaerophila TaxID=1484053 RepID=A0A1M4SQC0_9BACT|nr:transporter substrate-binding domain-containing protein [Mariniphaga anaerophila]SHE34147.1 extracellular solute-binding protein, family 3 [Mariniphaga anaerophila]
MMSVNEIFLSQNPNRLKKDRWQNAATPFFSLCSFLLIYVSTFGNASNAPSNAGYFNIDTITIASEPDYPPYCIVDKNGNADGFAIELFLAAAKATGLNVKVKVGIWELIKNDLAAGKIDALPFVGRTPPNVKKFLISLSPISFSTEPFLSGKRTPKFIRWKTCTGKKLW